MVKYYEIITEGPEGTSRRAKTYQTVGHARKIAKLLVKEHWCESAKIVERVLGVYQRSVVEVIS